MGGVVRERSEMVLLSSTDRTSLPSLTLSKSVRRYKLSPANTKGDSKVNTEATSSAS